MKPKNKSWIYKDFSQNFSLNLKGLEEILSPKMSWPSKLRKPINKLFQEWDGIM